MTTAQAPPPTQPDADPTAPTPLPPLRPRPVLLVVASVAFAVWTAFLIALYVTTVYPERHPSGVAPVGGPVETPR